MGHRGPPQPSTPQSARLWKTRLKLWKLKAMPCTHVMEGVADRLRAEKLCSRAFVPIYQAELTALVMSRMISVSSGWSFIIFSTRLMELRTVEW